MLRYLSNIQKSTAIYHLQSNELCRPKTQTSNTITKCENSTNFRQPKARDHGQPSFDTMVQNRRMQAMQTVVIESSPKEYNYLMEQCSKYGSIRHAYQHNTRAGSYFVIEFSRVMQVRELLRDVGYSQKSNSYFTSTGRFLKFAPTRNQSSTDERQFQPPEIDTKPKTWDQILAAVAIKRTINAQMQALYELGSLSELSIRLRFLTALQIEEGLSGIAANARVLPFGSSINGFGRTSSDLDMIYCIDKESKPLGELNFLQPLHNHFHPAAHLGVFSQILSTWMPGVSKVEEIFGARVPILKFNHTITGLKCDFGMGNLDGYHMSNLLYSLCKIDSRVQPLVIFIRQWAQMFKITPIVQPSPCITNFMLTCFVVFFLQQSKILPPTNTLVTTTTDVKQNVVHTISQINGKLEPENSSSLHELAVEFFKYYRNFAFNKKTIAITTGDMQPRTRDNPIEIINPLQTSLNVSAVVSQSERDRFVQSCEYAVRALTDKSMDIVQLFESAINIKTPENSGYRSGEFSREQYGKIQGKKHFHIGVDDLPSRTSTLNTKKIVDRREQPKSNKQSLNIGVDDLPSRTSTLNTKKIVDRREQPKSNKESLNNGGNHLLSRTKAAVKIVEQPKSNEQELPEGTKPFLLKLLK